MMFKSRIVVLVFVFCLVLVGCRSSKTVLSNGALNPKLSAKQIVKNSVNSNAKFTTLASKLKIEYIEGDRSQTYSVSLRMEKDKTIWISKLGIVKALITPNRVAFYNKLDNTYFDGDFTYLSKLLGTPLDFNKVQALLLGEPIYMPSEKTFKASVHDKSYMLAPKEQQDLFALYLLFNPVHFKMDSQQIEQSKKGRLLEVDYLVYQTVEKEILPERIKVIALENSSQLEINLEYKNIKLNEKLRFPFTIPSGYEEITLD